MRLGSPAARWTLRAQLTILIDATVAAGSRAVTKAKGLVMKIGVVGTGRIGAFHAQTLRTLPAVDEVIISDLATERGRAVAADLDLGWAPDMSRLLASGLDGLVVTTPTTAHVELVAAGVRAQVPTFVEKPLAASLETGYELVRLIERSQVPVHVGFQRRFDVGYRRLRQAVADGELGWLHTVKMNTLDAAPPPQEYVRHSGGILRDCNIHDFDILRFVTGQEVVRVFAMGANRGPSWFTDFGDVDTAVAVMTLTDGTLVFVNSTRFNGGGHDVRFEALGSTCSMAVGLDDTLALRSAEPDVQFPPGPVHTDFVERFLPAFTAEMLAFLAMARGEIESPCTVRDGLAASRIAEAATRSLREQKVVYLADILDI